MNEINLDSVTLVIALSSVFKVVGIQKRNGAEADTVCFIFFAALIQSHNDSTCSYIHKDKTKVLVIYY